MNAREEHMNYHRYVDVKKEGTSLTLTSYDNQHTERPVAFNISVNGAFIPVTLSPAPGSQVTVPGTDGKDRVIVSAGFADGMQMVVCDAYV